MHCGYAWLPSEPHLALVYACVQANEPSLYIRRRMLSIQYFFKLGLFPSNPAYNTVFSPKSKAPFSSNPNQIPTLGIRIAPELENISFKRNTVSRLSVPATPPWLLRRPAIDFTLHSSDKADTPPEVFKVRFYKLCDRFKIFLSYLQYTDGSKMGHRVSAALCHKRGTLSVRLPGVTSIFNAELHAILLALDVVRRSKEKHFIVLSDSYSSLIALGGSYFDQDSVYKYLKTYSTLTNSGKTVILCWVPGHVGIPGNERADRVAKAALSLAIFPFKISVTDFLPRAKLLMRREWQEIWNCCHGNKLHAINPTVGVTKHNGSLSRRDAVIMNRLQIGHTRATHAHLLGNDGQAVCTTCYTSLTVNHILIECPQFNHLRQQYHFGSTLKELFNKTSVNDIICFYQRHPFLYSHIIVVVPLLY